MLFNIVETLFESAVHNLTCVVVEGCLFGKPAIFMVSPDVPIPSSFSSLRALGSPCCKTLLIQNRRRGLAGNGRVPPHVRTHVNHARGRKDQHHGKDAGNKQGRKHGSSQSQKAFAREPARHLQRCCAVHAQRRPMADAASTTRLTSAGASFRKARCSPSGSLKSVCTIFNLSRIARSCAVVM